MHLKKKRPGALIYTYMSNWCFRLILSSFCCSVCEGTLYNIVPHLVFCVTFECVTYIEHCFTALHDSSLSQAAATPTQPFARRQRIAAKRSLGL